MPGSTNYSWSDLFMPDGPASSPVVTQTFRVLRRRGEPLLLLPRRGDLAAEAMSLYPAQSTLARAARFALRVAMDFGLPAGRRTELSFTSTAELPTFLRGLIRSENLPAIAVLAGNPRVAGRRFLVLVYDSQDRPALVVKAGIGAAAKNLVDREADFLESIPADTPGVPVVRARLSNRINAFALDFVPGDAPRGGELVRVEELLARWINPRRLIVARDLAMWQQLQAAVGPDPLFAQLDSRLADKQFYPALAHGDFAPWNIKVSEPGRWTVLDWERGELMGPPAWDWFHFFLQPAILVDKLSPADLVETTARMLNSLAFQHYAYAAGLTGSERYWLLAYLLYQRDVIRPAEGLVQTNGLLQALIA